MRRYAPMLMPVLLPMLLMVGGAGSAQPLPRNAPVTGIKDVPATTGRLD